VHVSAPFGTIPARSEFAIGLQLSPRPVIAHRNRPIFKVRPNSNPARLEFGRPPRRAIRRRPHPSPRA
jgi:hypothetical protein